MHNQVVNTHKSNAFKSTLSLLNTARSDDGNDKLLIQATQAIFAHQQSGYSEKESESRSIYLALCYCNNDCFCGS